MFERFTERARRVLFFARFDCSQLGSATIEPEHLLLGLMREPQGVTARLFTDAGLTLAELRDEVVRRHPARPAISTSVEIPFSPAAMGVLQHSAAEADRLSHDHIGTEHLLLGLLRGHGSVAAEILQARGLRLDVVRGRVGERLDAGGVADHPGPPALPANTFKWPWLRFVPSGALHVLYSELKPPQQPVTNYSGPGLQAYGHTLTEAIVQAWGGSRWHIDMPDGLDDGTRYDFYIQLAADAPAETFGQMWRNGLEQQFACRVTLETRRRDVWVARSLGRRGPMLRDYGAAEPGTGVALGSFNLVMRRPHDAPAFPLPPFTVHSVPFFYLARWFEEFLGGQVIDETGLGGIYGFELTRSVATRGEFVDLLREQAGVAVTRESRDVPTLLVRRR